MARICRRAGSGQGRGLAAVKTVTTVTGQRRARCSSRAPQDSTASSRWGETATTGGPSVYASCSSRSSSPDIMIVSPSPTLHCQPRARWSAADPLTGAAHERDCNLLRGPGPSITPGLTGRVVSEDSPGPGHGRYVLFLGRVDVHRAGLDLLLAAVSLAPPPLPVIVAGTGRRAERRKLVRLLGQTSGPVAWVGDVAAPARSSLLRQCAF